MWEGVEEDGGAGTGRVGTEDGKKKVFMPTVSNAFVSSIPFSLPSSGGAPPCTHEEAKRDRHQRLAEDRVHFICTLYPSVVRLTLSLSPRFHYTLSIRLGVALRAILSIWIAL